MQNFIISENEKFLDFGKFRKILLVSHILLTTVCSNEIQPKGLCAADFFTEFDFRMSPKYFKTKNEIILRRNLKKSEFLYFFRPNLHLII